MRRITANSKVTETIAAEFPRWMKMQRVAILANLAMTAPTVDQKGVVLDAIAKEFQASRENITNMPRDIAHSLKELNPSPGVLYHLEDLKKLKPHFPNLSHQFQQIAIHVGQAASSTLKQLNDRTASHSVWKDAEVIAHSVFLSSIDAPAFVRFIDSKVTRNRDFNYALSVDSTEVREIQSALDNLRPFQLRLLPSNALHADPLRIKAESLLTLRKRLRSRMQRIVSSGQADKLVMQHVTWEDIENAVFRLMFLWPLCIEEEDFSLPKDLAVLPASLPVMSHVRFGGNGSIAQAEIIEHRLINTDDWSDSLDESSNKLCDATLSRIVELTGQSTPPALSRLDYASYAAKCLWEKRNGYSDDIARATAVFDFSLAGKVLEQTIESIEHFAAIDHDCGYLFELHGGSMESLFATHVLNELTGTKSFTSSIVTGEIGCELMGEEGRSLRDFELRAVGGVAKKIVKGFRERGRKAIVYSKATDAFEHAGISHCIKKQKRKKLQSASVLKVDTLSAVADFECGGWRRDGFIRSPDLEYRFFSKQADRDWEVIEKQVLPKLRAGETVLDLTDDYDIDANTIVDTFRHLQDSRNDRSPGSLFVPWFSWVIVRAVDYELDERFIHTLWRAIGAPLSALKSLFVRCQYGGEAKTTRKAANLLFKALTNQLVSAIPNAPKAPDVVVLVGPEKLYRDDDVLLRNEIGRERNSYRPLAFSRIKPLLEGKKLNRAGRLKDQLGNTKIILVRDPIETTSSLRRKPIDNDKAELLYRHLSPFLYGIHISTIRHIARPLSKTVSLEDRKKGFSSRPFDLPHEEGTRIDSSEINKLLKLLKELEYVKEIHGTYYLPEFLGVGCPIHGTKEEQQSRIHLNRRAGYALLPMQDRLDRGSTNYDAAIQPSSIHDAHFLLSRASKWISSEPEYEAHVTSYLASVDLTNEINTPVPRDKYGEKAGRSRSIGNAKAELAAIAEFPSFQGIHTLLGYQGRGNEYVTFNRTLRFLESAPQEFPNPFHVWLLLYAANVAARRFARMDDYESITKMTDETEEWFRKAMLHPEINKEDTRALRLGILGNRSLLIQLSNTGLYDSHSGVDSVPKLVSRPQEDFAYLPATVCIDICDVSNDDERVAIVLKKCLHYQKKYSTVLVKFLGAARRLRDTGIRHLEFAEDLMRDEERTNTIWAEFSPQHYLCHVLPNALSEDKSTEVGRDRFIRGMLYLQNLDSQKSVHWIYRSLWKCMEKWLDNRSLNPEHFLIPIDQRNNQLEFVEVLDGENTVSHEVAKSS